jgi:hypothetical protein
MATGSPKIKVVVTGDATSFDRAMNRAAGKINGFGGTLRRVFNERIIGGALNLAADAIRGAFDFAQTGTDQFDALGDSLALIDKNAKGLASTVSSLDLTKLGFDKVETAVAAEDISATAKALGLSADEAKKLTPLLLEGAAAYSSLTGKDAKTAGDLFAKALGGSAKAAKELGVEFKKGMTPAQRTQAIMAKWGPLAEEAANGTRSLADEQATLDAKMSDLSTSVGGFLDQALQPLIAGLVNDLFPALQAFWAEHGPAIMDAFNSIAGVIGTIAGFIVDELVPVLLDLWGVFAEKVLPKIQAFYALIWEKLQPVLETLWGFFKTTAVPFLKDTFLPILGQLFDAFFKVAEFVAGAFTVAFDAVKTTIDILADAIGGVLDAWEDFVHFVQHNPISDLIGGAGDIIGGRSGVAPTFAATGGLAPLAATRSSGAAAAPGGAPNITINMGVGDPVAIGRQVARVLSAYRSRGGTI